MVVTVVVVMYAKIVMFTDKIAINSQQTYMLNYKGSSNTT